ncbi:MAG: dTMP kinase [Desulfohalobiaceae bacterium]
MLVTFEGIEGCGKSTQAWMLAEHMRQLGRGVRLSREPGGSSLGSELRGILLDGSRELDPRAELFLYLADRAQHVQEVILPALGAGELVIVDRFVDSTLAYQGWARGLGLEQALRLSQVASQGLAPDLTILLDLDAETSLARARSRDQSRADIREGKFEAQDLQFHRRVRQAYLELASSEPERIRTLDARGEPEQVQEQVLKAFGLAS